MGSGFGEYCLEDWVGEYQVVLRQVVVDKLRHRKIDIFAVGGLNIFIYNITAMLQNQFHQKWLYRIIRCRRFCSG